MTVVDIEGELADLRRDHEKLKEEVQRLKAGASAGAGAAPAAEEDDEKTEDEALK